ncbi:uncharacterized protein ColSpa_04163 [Colletotrichum spaethianum]|uniref:Uncharacterized protein n=1 Tax=Colletotrichum spaethianum TaxID=700344 RepID=A0AA37L8W1_9PEZI|nr:uncharacterized protein ColSpa_04163 [Colletotrichum spaethianum]GKT43982.1 hypothetical protein ColSpa_04163 [Colletotrichum spaethianum]
MDKDAQMEAARLLALEFKSGSNSRRGDGARGGSRGARGGRGTRGVGLGRVMDTPRSVFPHSPTGRPISTTSRPVLAVGNVNRAPTQINPALAGWLSGQKTDHNTTNETTTPTPIDPKLSSWLTHNSQSQPPSASSSPISNATVGLGGSSASASTRGAATAIQSNAVSQSQTLTEPVRVMAQPESHASSINKTSGGQPKASDSPFAKKTTSTSKLNGLGMSMWASEELTNAHTQNGSKNPYAIADTDLSTRASTMLQEQSVDDPTATYNRQASQLLETDHIRDETQKIPNIVGGNLPLRQQPKVGTMLWALQQLDAGLELPDPQLFNAHKDEVKGVHLRAQSGATPKPDNAIDAASQIQDQMVEKAKANSTILINDLDCHCPKRSHPVIGLAASKYNTDADGDVDISGMSATARNKFAVNVILQDHPLPDCPVLLKTQATYPLYFGANPATVNDKNDGLSVTRWEESHHATRPLSQQHQARSQQQSDGGRGLMSSIWAA